MKSNSESTPSKSNAGEQPKPVNRGISISDLTVTAGDKILLDDTSVEFKPDQITLVVGPSGVGKSILLKLVAGILDASERGIKYSGSIKVNGQRTRAGNVGVVFQSFALFDELTPRSNVEFARSQTDSSEDKNGVLSTDDLFKRLDIPTSVPTSRLSGGQKQRLAIARTIAFNPPIIVYDEPTSGLDPATGQQVATLIRETHESYGETTIIVTHDYPSLLPIADSVFLLDPNEKKIRELKTEEWESLPEILDSVTAKIAKPETEPPSTSFVSRFAANSRQFFEGTANSFGALLVGIVSLIPFWKSPRWGWQYFLHYCRMVFGPTAIIYLALAGVISGFVTTFFTFKFLPYSTYTEPLLIEDLLTALGFAMYRIFVPVLGCVLVAARCGAAVTSDVGGRQFGNQIDAMKSFNKSPRLYLLTPIIWAFLIGTPLLYFSSYFAARLVSLITFVQTYPERGPDFWHTYFHRGLIVAGQDLYRGTGWLFAKLLCSGFGVALISYFMGRRPKYSSSDVSGSITTTILLATLYVLTVHFLFSFFEYEGVVPGTRVNPASLLPPLR